MAETEQTKICPHCAETIKAAAKVCPHCRYCQKRWSLQNPQIGVTIWTLVAFGTMIGFGAFFDKAFGPKQQFATYRDEISVVSSQFNQHLYGSNLWVTVVGIITNSSDVGWKDVGVEAQFFDKSGKLIDAITVNSDDYHSVVILPHGTTAFKIEGKASRSASDYETNKLSVRWAKDADAWLP
jgi:hypothetical protein